MPEDKEEEESELEEEVVKEIEKNSIREISNDFTQETGSMVVEDQDKLKEFISDSFSTRRISPSLEKIQEVQQQIDFEQDFSPKEESQNFQKMYGAAAREEKRLYDSQSRSMEPPVLAPNRITQRTQFIDPLEGRNIQTQNNMQPEMIRTQTEHKRQRLPFEKENNYREVKLHKTG